MIGMADKKVMHLYKRMYDFIKPFENFKDKDVQKRLSIGLRFSKKDWKIAMGEMHNMGYIKKDKRRMVLTSN